jgi:predicted lipoprotein with Yx(FWY)xxD motif
MSRARRGRSVVSRPAFRAMAFGPLVLAGAMVLAACQGTKVATNGTTTGSSSTIAGSAGSAGSSAPATAPVVLLANLPGHPRALTTAGGFVLYTYSSDTAGTSACVGTCLTFWPALLLPSGTTTPLGGPGVSGLGTISRAEGLQVTFNGKPLYTFQQDTKAGVVTGQGDVVSGGTFDLAVFNAPVAAAGTPTTGSATTSTSRSTTAPTVASTTSPSVKTTMVTAPPTTRKTAPSTSPTTVPRTTVPTTAPSTTQPSSTTSTTYVYHY